MMKHHTLQKKIHHYNNEPSKFVEISVYLSSSQINHETKHSIIWQINLMDESVKFCTIFLSWLESVKCRVCKKRRQHSNLMPIIWHRNNFHLLLCHAFYSFVNYLLRLIRNILSIILLHNRKNTR